MRLQDKLIRHFQGKIIRQFFDFSGLLNVTWGGAVY